jgi:hypothetical protein
MKALEWVTLGAVAVVAAIDCTGGERSRAGGGGGTTTARGGSAGDEVPDAGRGGTGRGGSAGASGAAGGTAGKGSVGAFGEACVSDSDCDGLICVGSADLSGGGPPNGLCTAACLGDADCETLSPGSLCFRLTEELAACFEPCTVGSSSDPDCHARDEFACQGYDTVPTSDACTEDDDCGSSAYCGDDGTCLRVLTACLPACGGDFHCIDGYCDPRSGFCVSEPIVGLPNGTLCDPGSASDACAGICVRFSEEGGMCSSVCNVSATAACGFEPNADPADAACLWPPLYSDPTDRGIADPGFCGPLCDCSADCAFSDWICFDGEAEFSSGFGRTFGRGGFCGPPTIGSAANVLDDCGSGGAGGHSVR